jgi:hypothetical protein
VLNVGPQLGSQRGGENFKKGDLVGDLRSLKVWP